MSNLKQIGLGIMQYAQDFDEKLPRSIADFTTRPASYTVFRQIDPYLKSTQILVCPSFTGTGASYGYNYIYLGRSEQTGTALASIQEVARTVMMTDQSGTGVDWIYSAQYWGRNGGPSWANSTGNSGEVVDRHLETTNVLWADGHVKSQKLTALQGSPGCTGVACDELWDLN